VDTLHKTTQTGNAAGNDIVGRDKHVTETVFNFPSHEGCKYIEKLYRELGVEVQTDEDSLKFIDDLEYYYLPVEGDVQGLEAKLRAGDRTAMLKYGKEAKELFHKKLMKTSQFSLVGQRINLYLLSQVRSFYINKVYPLVCKHENMIVINNAIEEGIVRPLTSMLGSNELEFTPDEINGMLYFLTGNCHVQWTE
jgi:hypothetical protein